MDVWPSLRENGILIYSTCTFNPDENERNIKWLLDKQEAVSLKLDVNRFAGIKEIDYQGINGYGFLPDKVRGEGLFFSVIKKTAGHRNGTVRIRKNPCVKVSREELARAGLWTEFKPERIVRMNEDLIAIPGDYQEMLILFERLKVIRFGTKILTVKGNSYLPSHEAALSNGLKTDAFPGAELDLNQAINYLKRGIPEKPDVPKGWFLLRYMGVNLGFANNVGTRINNYFPVGWRIRIPFPVNSDPGIIKWDEKLI